MVFFVSIRGDSIPPELLAPAGSSETFLAAIAAGADAVYLGGTKFNARHFASNFQENTLLESVQYAHLRGISVYVTLNTLIHDDEIPDVLDYVIFLCSIGIDAILIQDVGLVSLLNQILKDLVNVPSLHASTQMSLHNQEGAEFASELGCSRIVLAREVPVSEISSIGEQLKKKGTGIEIFVHGALCYAFSGQCLLSSVIGGRSGNRGMCAQPCRKPYDLVMGIPDRYGVITDTQPIHIREKYLLSTRDLCLYPVLEKISKIPVESLKIEGRMRSPQYVAIVTCLYRNALDCIQTGTFHPNPDDETKLSMAFSRGFTTGYFDEIRSGPVMGRDLPGKRGLCIGKVIRTGQGGRVIIRREGTIIPRQGDGLVSISRTSEEGFILSRPPRIEETEIELIIPTRCSVGDEIYLTSSSENNKFFKELTQNPDKRFLGSIILDLKLIISPDGTVQISGQGITRTGEQVFHSFISREKFSTARTRPLSSDQIAEAVRKTGGTRYAIRELEITCPQGLFVPLSVLNSIRREIFSEFDSIIIGKRLPSSHTLDTIKERCDRIISGLKRDKCSILENNEDIQIIGVVSDPDSMKQSLYSGANRVYYEWYPRPQSSESRTLDEIIQFAHDNPDIRNKIGIKLPKIVMRNELDVLYEIIPKLTAHGINHVLTDGHGLQNPLKRHSPDLVISGYSGLNITNHFTLNACTGYDFLTLSSELSGYEIVSVMNEAFKDGLSIPVAIIVQGLLEAMVSCDTLKNLVGSERHNQDIFGIRDQKGVIFPVFSDNGGKTHIFNGAETTLIDKIPEIIKSGIRILIIDGRMRTPEYMRIMVEQYKKAIVISKEKWSAQTGRELKDLIRPAVWGDMTAATWKRGIRWTSKDS